MSLALVTIFTLLGEFANAKYLCGHLVGRNYNYKCISEHVHYYSKTDKNDVLINNVKIYLYIVLIHDL